MEKDLMMYDPLFEQDPWVQSKVAEAEARGEARAKAETEARIKALKVEIEARAEAEVEAEEIETLQKTVIVLVESRFPGLTSFAREKVVQIKNLIKLNSLLTQVAMAPDEATTRFVITSFTV